MDRKKGVGLLLAVRAQEDRAEDMPDLHQHQHQPPGPGHGRPPPSAAPKAQARPQAQGQALPGVYIVHAAPLFRVPLDGQAAPSKQAVPDYKWSARMSPDNRRASLSPSLSVEAGAGAVAVAGRSTPPSYVQAEVGAAVAARLRSSRTSLADSGLHSGTSGPGPGHPGLPGLRNGAQRLARDDSAGDHILDCMRRTLRPMMLILVVYGVIPVKLRPPCISMHPLRSTLLYVLVVQTSVALSAHYVLRSYSGLLHLEPRDARGVDERLLAILSIAHVSSHCIILVLWAELRHVRTCRAHVILFVKTYGHMLGANPFGLWTRCMPWFSVIFTFVLAPCLMFVWCIKILKAPLLLHGPSHLSVLNCAFTVLAFFAQACNVVREFASAVAAGLKEELDTGRMTADRLEEFRLAWISLRQLTTDLGSMPLTGLSLIFYLLLMTTLTTYQAAVSFYNNYTVLFVATCCILVLTQFALLHVCDVAHRLQDVMSDGFCEPLESKSWRGLPADLLTEHQQFLRTITTNPAEVTFAGVVSIKRSTYLSIMAAIATYLIVLFQLRMADEDLPTTPLPPLNTTDSSLDSVFRSRT